MTTLWDLPNTPFYLVGEDYSDGEDLSCIIHDIVLHSTYVIAKETKSK